MKAIMFLAMIAEIVFAANERRSAITLKRITSCKVFSGWERMTDNAEIILPRNVKEFREKNVNDVFKRGDAVKISFGYNGKLQQEFEGYLSEVGAEIPVRLMCEDEMHQLKKMSVNKVYENPTLKYLVSDITGGAYEVDAMDVKLGDLRFEKVTAAKVLQKLKDDFGIYSYFQPGTKKLVSGKIYTDNAEEVNIDLQRIPGSNLKYRNAEDMRLKVTATSLNLSDGSKLEVSVGDEDGEERKLSYLNIGSEAELKKMAEADMARLKVSGYEGSISTFGIPFIQHGCKINLKSVQYPERDGKYYADSADPEFSDSSTIRREVKIGKRAA